MFSFIKGKPIAKIYGGDFSGKAIHIATGDEKDEICCNKCSKKCKYKPCCEYCPYHDEELGTEFRTEGTLMPIPNMETREVGYICGPSGSGKSTHSSKYIGNFKKLFPEKKFYVFSRLGNDQVIDSLNPIRININDELIENPVDITQDLKDGGIVLFDDVNTIPNDKLRKTVAKIRNDILEVGRHNNVYIINTSHIINPNDGKDGRVMLNECHFLTVFPKSGNIYQIESVLQKYFGYSKEQIDKIMNLDSRWVTLYKGYPQFVMYEHGCFIPQRKGKNTKKQVKIITNNNEMSPDEYSSDSYSEDEYDERY